MKDITKENTIENMEQKDGRRWPEPSSCTDHNKKNSDFSFDYSVHNEGDDFDEQNHSSEDLVDYSVHKEGNDHDKQKHSSENPPSKDVDTSPVQCTEDKLQRLSEEKCSKPEAKDCQQEHVTFLGDDIDLTHATAETGQSECDSPDVKLWKFKDVADISMGRVRIIRGLIRKLNRKLSLPNQTECVEPSHQGIKPLLKVHESELKLKYRGEEKTNRKLHGIIWKLTCREVNRKLSLPNQTECVEPSHQGIKPLLKVHEPELKLKYRGEEKTNRKLPQPNQAECMESSPLDIKPFLRVRGPRQEVIVFMQHGYTAQVSSPNTGKQSKEDMTPPKQHYTEFSRLATYIEYPLSLPFFAITLARDGFIYKSDELLIECFFCKLRISLSELRNPGADPVKTHSSKSPACPLKRGECSGNVPVPRVDENGTLSRNPSHENGGTITHSSSDMASGSKDNPGERPLGSWYHGDEATVLPSPVIHHNPAPDLTTDSVPSEQQVQKLPPSSRSNTGKGVLQPGNNDGSVQQPSVQRPNPPPTASSTRTADNAPSLQRSEDAAALANQKGSINGGSRNRSRPGSSPPSSGQNGAAGSSSSPSRPSASATANPSKNPKSSKKTKAAKRADAASRRTAANSSASGSNVPTPAQNSSNKNDSGASSDKGPEKDKEKKKLTYEDLGIFAEKPKRPDMAVLSKRLGTFEGKWKTSFAKTPQTLAECGMYYAGYADCARCFFCGGGLKNWEAPDEPWIEHARWFPKCAYILLHKGSQFVEIVQKKNKSNQKIIMKDVEEEMKSKSSVSSVALPASVAVTGSGENTSRSRGSSDHMNTDLAKLEAENEELLAQVTCKICMDAKSSVVFLPCGHMVACTDCAIVLKNCPLCRADIRGSVKAQI